MKTVTTRPAFQGELMIRRIAVLPSSAKLTDPTKGHHIVAHSESGHHHVVDADLAQRFIDDTNAFISYLSVADKATIEHLRSYDTHETLELDAGVYEVRLAREYTAEGFRPSTD
jgi:hypothetical protein